MIVDERVLAKELWTSGTDRAEVVPDTTHRDGRTRLALHPVWVLVAGCCAIFFRLAENHGLTNDVYWQWASGRWMLSHHQVLSRDVFSYTVLGHRWVDEEWGFQVLLAASVRAIGSVSFVLLPAGTCAAALVVSCRRWRRLGSSFFGVGTCALLATCGLVLGDAPRPQTFSYSLFALELYLLTKSRHDPRDLRYIPLLACIWANVHGSFLLAPLLIALELGTSLLRSPRGLLAVAKTAPTRALGRCLALTLVGCAINPDGIALYHYALAVGSNAELGQLISEWQSPNFHSLYLFGLVLIPCAALGLALLTGSRRFDLFDLVCFGLVLTMALHSQRFLPYVAIAFGGLTAAMTREVHARPRAHPTFATLPVAIGLSVVLVLTGIHISPGSAELSGPGAEPVSAVHYLMEHPGRTLSTYTWGDYLINEGIPVFVDGRTDLYFGSGVLETYTALAALTTDPDAVLDRWDVRFVLWPSGQALARYLAHDPRWHVVEQAGPATVFSRLDT